MQTTQEVFFLVEDAKNSVANELVIKLEKGQQKRENELIIIPRICNQSTISKYSGEILLVSLSFIPYIEYMNELEGCFDYVNFIDPIAYSQFDEQKLYQQIEKIKSRKKADKTVGSMRRSYYDYYKINAGMM